MRRLLVTGGTGYLGAEIVRHALAAGWDVAATWRTREPPGGPAHWHRLDLTDPVAVAETVIAVQPDVVINTAYRRDGPGAAAVTTAGAAAVARAANAEAARVIHLSTDVVFDGGTSTPYTEGDRPAPITAYGRAKHDAETAVRDAAPPALVVRTSLLYGGSVPGPHETAALAAARGESTGTFFTDEIRCPTEVGDLAAALLELSTVDTSGVLHLAGPDAVSRYEFARLIATAAGQPTDRIRPGNSTDHPTPRPRNCALDSTRAATLITAIPRGVHEVLATPAAERQVD
jgi:dTDP-4-dehydrorhamnose reductase